MNNKGKMFILGILFTIGIIVTLVFIFTKLYDYLIVLFPFTIIMFVWFVIEICGVNSSPDDIYNHTLNKIIRIYNPILVNTDKFPKLNNKSVLNVSNFDDLVDAQAEMRKPIYYVKGLDSTAFYIINDDVFLIFFLKINAQQISELEIELQRVELKSSLNLDAVRDFDKTVIVQTPDKAYKVSPIRDENRKNNDENFSEQKIVLRDNQVNMVKKNKKKNIETMLDDAFK